MPELTQAELERKVKILCTNGVLANAQAVISSVGCTPAKLGDGASLLATVEQGHAHVQQGLQTQKSATLAEAGARATAHGEMTSFADTARIVFADDEPTLSALLLTTQYTTPVGPDGQPGQPEAERPPESTAEVLKRWQTQLTVAQGLAANQLAALGSAGWNTVRLGKAAEAVAAFSTADIAQQAAIQTYQSAQARLTEDIEALRKWYSSAAALCKRAIKDADPHDTAQLMELLDL